MKQRCPDSLFVGIALLEDNKLIINSTSYTSIIPSVGDVVYSSLDFLSSRDEKALDISEGVPGYMRSSILTFTASLMGR